MMKIININQVPKDRKSGMIHGVYHIYPESAQGLPAGKDGEMNPEASWVGSITIQRLLSKQAGTDGLNAHVVNFDIGARTKFHTHSREQMIIAFAGTGTQATEEEESVVKVGDVIHIPAGEKHWHGATKESEFSQLSVFAGDRESKWLED
jgi:quercetin dioxygenase-like cupin family protein